MTYQPMDWEDFKANWHKLEGKARQEWAKLTNDDLEIIAGQRQELIGRVQLQYGLSAEKATEQVDRWAETLRAQSPLDTSTQELAKSEPVAGAGTG